MNEKIETIFKRLRHTYAMQSVTHISDIMTYYYQLRYSFPGYYVLDHVVEVWSSIEDDYISFHKRYISDSDMDTNDKIYEFIEVYEGEWKDINEDELSMHLFRIKDKNVAQP